MRLRTFTAKTMPEAMALVRKQLGSDAVILSTGRVNGGISVTAALDHVETANGNGAATAELVRPEPPNDPIEDVHETLNAHGTPAPLVERILTAALERSAVDPLGALADGLDAVFAFAPLSDRPTNRPLMLVGPPGAGKTVSIAKLATRAVLAGRKPVVISSDTIRAGGIAQLESFICMLGLELHRADSARQLGQLVAASGEAGPVLIDSAGINPYSASDRGELAAYLVAAGAEPMLVLPAGGDLFDSIEIAHAFASLGAKRLLTTRLDMVHRLGSQLAAADAAQLSFCDVSLSADIAKGLVPLNAVALARLLMPGAPQVGAQLTPERAR
jgi:flagellar biosynthesis protein FlhF